MMTTNLFAIANVKQLRTYVVLEFYCLFFRTSWCVGVLNAAFFFKQFSQSGWVWHDFLEDLRNFGRGGWTPETPPPRVRHWFVSYVLLLVLSCLVCNCCWLTVCIVVVVFCVLLSYVSLLYYVGIAVFYFRCRTAGSKSVFGRSWDRPSRHRVFLVSLCLKENAQMVPKIPSCHYMLLLYPPDLNLSVTNFMFCIHVK